MDQVNDELGYWEILHPSYTILNKETKTFSSIWTPYDENFAQFYKSCVTDIETFSKSSNLFPKPHMPENMFNISSLPWIDFTSFNLNVSTDETYLLPIFTLGQFKAKEEKSSCPSPYKYIMQFVMAIMPVNMLNIWDGLLNIVKSG